MKRWNRWKQWTAVLLCLLLLCNSTMPAFAAAKNKDTTADYAAISRVVDELAPVLAKTPAKPGAIGGEWRVMGLARSSETVAASYYDSYYKALAAQLKQKKGILMIRHSK